jgi:hypothetical protein
MPSLRRCSAVLLGSRPKQQCHVAHPLHQVGAQLGADFSDNGVPSFAVFCRNADFHEFVMSQGTVDFPQYCAGKAVIAKPDHSTQFMAAAAEFVEKSLVEHE